MTGQILYALACVVLPALWALFMAAVFDRLERRRVRRGGSEPRVPPIDYSI